MKTQYFSVKTDLITAAFFALISLVIYFILIRSVPELESYGIIQGIEFYEKYSDRKRLNSINHTINATFTEQAKFVYIIKLENGKKARFVEYATHTLEPDYKIGDKLLVTYTLRHIPFFGDKITVYKAESHN